MCIPHPSFLQKTYIIEKKRKKRRLEFQTSFLLRVSLRRKALIGGSTHTAGKEDQHNG